MSSVVLTEMQHCIATSCRGGSRGWPPGPRPPPPPDRRAPLELSGARRRQVPGDVHGASVQTTCHSYLENWAPFEHCARLLTIGHSSEVQTTQRPYQTSGRPSYNFVHLPGLQGASRTIQGPCPDCRAPLRPLYAPVRIVGPLQNTPHPYPDCRGLSQITLCPCGTAEPLQNTRYPYPDCRTPLRPLSDPTLISGRPSAHPAPLSPYTDYRTPFGQTIQRLYQDYRAPLIPLRYSMRQSLDYRASVKPLSVPV